MGLEVVNELGDVEARIKWRGDSQKEFSELKIGIN